MSADKTLCGARRPGWDRGPAIGRLRLPCVREGHESDGDHLDALGETWPPSCQDCGTTSGPFEGLAIADADGPVRDGHVCGPCADAAAAPEPAGREPSPAARRPVRMCMRCEHITPTPVLVLWIDSGSGPGWNLYACPDCAHHYLTPDAALQLAVEHAVACPACSGDGLCATGRTLDRVNRAALDRAWTMMDRRTGL